jgi:hypothetical protein
MLVRSAVARARTGVSRGMAGVFIEVVMGCLGSFIVGYLGKGVKSRVLGHIEVGWCLLV